MSRTENNCDQQNHICEENEKGYWRNLFRPNMVTGFFKKQRNAPIQGIYDMSCMRLFTFRRELVVLKIKKVLMKRDFD